MSIFGGLLLGAGTITAVYGDRITGWFPGPQAGNRQDQALGRRCGGRRRHHRDGVVMDLLLILAICCIPILGYLYLRR
jgi:hypothetical protein